MLPIRFRLVLALALAPLVASIPAARMAGCAATAAHGGHHHQAPGVPGAIGDGCCLTAPCGATWRPHPDGAAVVAAPLRAPQVVPPAARELVLVAAPHRQPPAMAPPVHS